MDSGNNSASLQSSSTGGGVGGDEEYDSRAPSDSAFHTQNSSMFDPFANYFNPISRPQPPPPPPSHNFTATPNSLFNLDTDWSLKPIRSDQTNNPLLLPSADKSSTYFNNNSLSFGGISFPSSSSEHRGGSGNVSVTTTTTEPVAAAAADQAITQPARNPKKRSRASRRAPTTVLTTDTTNFRAMVQEFTGIPAPPFTSTSFFPQRTRFDLFASAPNSAITSLGNTAAAANTNPFNISQPPNYLRRPFPQKIQPPPPFISPSSSASSLMLSSLPNINIASGSGSSSTTTSSVSNSTINYQLSSGVAQNSSLFNTIKQNSIITSLLQQSSQKYRIGSKEHEQFQMPSSNEEFSMNSSAQHGQLLSGLPNLISQEQAAAAARNNNSINAANFHGDKVQETATTRGGEGTVESWICSSD